LRLQVGLRNLQATALMRDSRAQDMSFEIVDMTLEERSKYRRMLAGHVSNTPGDSQSELAPAPAESAVAR
jgi:hypothetical protein